MNKNQLIKYIHIKKASTNVEAFSVLVAGTGQISNFELKKDLELIHLFSKEIIGEVA